MHIEIDDLSRPEIHALLNEHLQSMHALSPPESVHALDLSKLRAPEITFWSAWDGSQLLGCGALKELDPKHGEVKSMRTPETRRRQGTGRAILAHLIGVARSRGYARLSLETGSMSEFTPAHRLYESFGFTFCGPFGEYVEDPHSVFMTMRLQDSGSWVSDREQKVADYIAGARQRAQRRKSPWNLVLIPLGIAATAGAALGLFKLVWLVHTTLYPLHELRNFWPAGISPGSFSLSFLMVFAPLPGALGAGFMLANLLLYALPPARRVFDAEARGHHGTGFKESMRGLLRLTAWALPSGLAVALAAAALLKSLQ